MWGYNEACTVDVLAKRLTELGHLDQIFTRKGILGTIGINDLTGLQQYSILSCIVCVCLRK